MLLFSPIPALLPGQITQEVEGCFCYAVNKEGYFCILHDNMKWSSIGESSCPCNGNINAVSSHAMKESKDPWVLLLCLKLAFESKWMTCSAGTYLDMLSDFWADAKLPFFFLLVYLLNISSLLFFCFCLAVIREIHWRDVFWGKILERLSRQTSEVLPAVEIRLCAVAQIRGNSQHMIFITWLPWLNTLFCLKRVGD